MSRRSLLLDLHVCAGRSDEKIPSHAVSSSCGSSERVYQKTGSSMCQSPRNGKSALGVCLLSAQFLGESAIRFVRRACLL